MAAAQVSAGAITSANMLKLLREMIFILLRYSGIPFVLRELIQRRKITILVYHALQAARAGKHFQALRARYHVISLADYLRARANREMWRLPRKSLIITFDDGHRSNFELRKLLEELGLPITIFLCSGIVGTHRHYWWFYTPATGESAACKKMVDAERLAFLSGRGYQEEWDYPDRQALSRSEIDALKPWVDFQAHTITHPILPACSDEKAEREIWDCKGQLEAEYGFNVQALAFPNGDYTEREINLARKAGYSCALTLDRGFNDQNTDLFRLRRIPVPDEASMSELLVKSSGLWDVFRSPAHLRIRRREARKMSHRFALFRRGSGYSQSTTCI
jgi:peptidoglycan/xylan/chitin deacetylase (PgdA/CDA1 family)